MPFGRKAIILNAENLIERTNIRLTCTSSAYRKQAFEHDTYNFQLEMAGQYHAANGCL
jgi:hypothetical protein